MNKETRGIPGPWNPVLLCAVCFVFGAATPAQNDPQEAYRSRQAQQTRVVAEWEQRLGRSFSSFAEEDYAEFLAALDLEQVDDLWQWSHVTGVGLFAVRESIDFYRANAHLLEDREAASRRSREELQELQSTYDRASGQVRIQDAAGQPLPVREAGSQAVRRLALVGQVRHNEGFAEDRTVLEALDRDLVPLAEVDHLPEVAEAIRALPLSMVRVLRGKAIYLGTGKTGTCEAVWHCISSDLYPGFGGMQPCVFVEQQADGNTTDALLRGLGRLIRETVLEREYFGLYAHAWQYPVFQALQPERRRVFGRRRDRLPQTDHGYVHPRARQDAQENFTEHFRAYLREKESFLARARQEESQGRPELLQKYRFLERMVEHTPATAERLTADHIAQVDPVRQRAVLQEYLTRQAQGPAVVARLERDFGKPFPDFTEDDYARFLGALDLNQDDDLWTWSHATGIPLAALSRRSITFHRNLHLVADATAANRMSYDTIGGVQSSYDAINDRVHLHDAAGQPLEVRPLPAGVIQQTATTDGVVHTQGFAEDRLWYEALESYLVPLADLENRADLSEGIRLLPLSIVQAHRGKALYPTTLSRTGWAVTWRVSNDRTVSYVGMVSGSLIEPRRDPRRAPIPAAELVAHGVESLKGSSADSLVHEVGHILDHSVIGGRAGGRSFPYQFPEFQKLLKEKERLFGIGDSPVPQTDHGYVSKYAKVNAQEHFAETFWAYVRDRDAFLARAHQEQADGHPELLQKFRFLERLVDHTPAVMERLSPEFLERQKQEAYAQAAAALPDETAVLEEYLAHEARKETVIAEAEETFRKSVEELTEDDYAHFLQSLDLDGDQDLFTWSHVTGIPILAVRKSSSFFYENLHLLKSEALAEQLGGARIQEQYDADTGTLTLLDDQGEVLPIRDLPEGIIRPTGRMGRFWYLDGFGEDRIVHQALAPYLVPVRDLDFREHIGGWIRSLPLSVVRLMRGKGIYFTTTTGRSYAVAMPCSNTTYKIFVGLQTGVFVDSRRDGPAGTWQNFVHEIGHLVDYSVLLGGYGKYRQPHQYPEWRKSRPEKELLFGKRDDKVPQTAYGYISRYARSNAQESFAEHFRAFLLERDKFLAMARDEVQQGHPELMAKFRFLEQLIERTPTTRRRVSEELLVQEAAWDVQYEQLCRLREARHALGEDAPASLTALIDDRMQAAFREAPAKEGEAKAYGKALDQVIKDVARGKGRGEDQTVLASLLGVTLEVAFDRAATTAQPVMKATLRGADEGVLSGTVTFEALGAKKGRFGAAQKSDVEVGAGESVPVDWRPGTGEDHSPFTARVTAELRWKKRSLTLTEEVVGRPSIPVWWTVGPFDNPGGATEDLVHPPESGPVDLKQAFEGAGGQTLTWQEVRRDPESKVDAEFVVDFDQVFGAGENAACYAVVWVHADRAMDAVLSFGSADGAVVWANGAREFQWLEGRRDYSSRANQVPIRLAKGSNEVLVKVTVSGNGWRFGGHLTDAAGRVLEGVRYGVGGAGPD